MEIKITGTPEEMKDFFRTHQLSQLNDGNLLLEKIQQWQQPSRVQETPIEQQSRFWKC